MEKLYNKLLIIDGSYMLHRQLHVGNLWELNNGAQKTGGIFGFLRSLGSVIRKVPAGYYPVVCWDSGLSPARLEVFSNYKCHDDKLFESKLLEDAQTALSGGTVEGAQDYLDLLKAKMEELKSMGDSLEAAPDEDYMYQYRSQRNDIIDLLGDLGIASIKVPDWEGDDLMTLLTRLSHKSIIVTDDSDLRQLVSEDVTVMRVLKGVSFVTIKDLLNEGLSSAHDIAKIKAITGDSSDNVPQLVKRLGYSTASKVVEVINEYHDNPDEYLDALKIKFANKAVVQEFIKCHDNYLRNLKLVDLSYVPNDDTTITILINEVSKLLKVNYLSAVAKLGRYSITEVPVDEIISYAVSSHDEVMSSGD